MTESSTPDVGRATIDAYLDSVEHALMAAHAPRSDRLQVLQDLESQIAEMLAREPAPLTEESVSAVIENWSRRAILRTRTATQQNPLLRRQLGSHGCHVSIGASNGLLSRP